MFKRLLINTIDLQIVRSITGYTCSIPSKYQTVVVDNEEKKGFSSQSKRFSLDTLVGYSLPLIQNILIILILIINIMEKCVLCRVSANLQFKWTDTQRDNAHFHYAEYLSIYSVNGKLDRFIMLTRVYFQNENPGPGSYCPLPSAETFSPSFSKKGTTSFPSKVSPTLVIHQHDLIKSIS